MIVIWDLLRDGCMSNNSTSNHINAHKENKKDVIDFVKVI